LKVTFLGTGTSQGVPVIGCECEVCRSLDFRDQRLRSSVLIDVDGRHLVIDTGPDFRQQMLRAGTRHLDAVLLTHSHRDHLAGLDDIRAFNYLQSKDMPIFATTDTLDRLKSEFDYAFAQHRYPGIPQLQLHQIDGRPFDVDDVRIIPLPVLHHNMPVLGFRIGQFSYITDANSIPESTIEILKGTDTLVLNALQKERHISHFNLEEAVATAAMIGARKTYFTHISHKLGLHNEVDESLPDSVSLAYDGLTLSF
jgi:phosphoribosyl 1,2-cyclic phosphate phosphodiesterase